MFRKILLIFCACRFFVLYCLRIVFYRFSYFIKSLSEKIDAIPFLFIQFICTHWACAFFNCFTRKFTLFDRDNRQTIFLIVYVYDIKAFGIYASRWLYSSLNLLTLSYTCKHNNTNNNNESKKKKRNHSYRKQLQSSNSQKKKKPELEEYVPRRATNSKRSK